MKSVFRKRKNPFFLYFLITILLFCGFVITNFSKNEVPNISETIKFLPTPAFYPKNTTDNQPSGLTAKAVVVLDADSGTILFEKNSSMTTPPASTTKIMSALVALENFKIDQIIEIQSPPKVEGQTMRFYPGEKISVENLLYGLLIASANDAALVLASNFPNGQKGFVWAMNQKAKEIKMERTNFTNPIGFDEPNHYTTALDLARLSLVAMKNEEFAKIVGTSRITVYDTTGKIPHYLTNINLLVEKLPQVKGVKTGWTQQAGECLVSFVEQDGKKIIIVVLGSEDRFEETEKLINWVFENFTWESFIH